MNIYTEIDRLSPYKIANYITSPRKMSYADWLKSPVMDAKKDWTFNDGEYYTHKDFIMDFYKDLVDIMHSCGYNIEDEKEFKREIATFIYRLSKESL